MNIPQTINYQFNPMRLDEAKSIVNWTYDYPYSIYNMSDDSEDIQELMDGSYFSVSTMDNELLGFFCFGNNAQVPAGEQQGMYQDQAFLDIGLGMRPDLTGKGRGREYMLAGIQFAQAKYKQHRFRLSVAAFNKRAIALYEGAGFRSKATFINGSQTAFLVMERE